MNKKNFKYFLFIQIIYGFVFEQSLATNYYSRQNGNWNTGTTWSKISLGGASCGCIPNLANGNSITIGHNVTLDRHLTTTGGSSTIQCTLTINAGATLNGASTYDVEVQKNSGNLTVCGTLIARDIQFDNGSIVVVCAGGTVTANRNFENQNSSVNIIINGNLYVTNTYANQNGGIICGSGWIHLTLPASAVNLGSTFALPSGSFIPSPCPTPLPCIIHNPCSPLPVELLSFDVNYEPDSVRLDWITASEVNNDYFQLQRSADGKNFSDLEKIKGMGNTTTLNTYSIFDKNPLNGYSYYRLIQVDFNGVKNYLPVKAIRITENKEGVSILPNPSNGKNIFLVNSGVTEVACTLMILDPGGNLTTILNNLILRSGFNDLDNKLGPISKGTYFVSIVIDNTGKSFHQRLVIIN